MAKSIEELIRDVEKEVQKMVKPSRYDHCVRVAETARILCERYDLDGQLGYLAGIAHDMCKEMDGKKLISLAKQDGDEICQLELNSPGLLHGRAAAVYLEQKLEVTDKAVLEAVRYHTVGCTGMCELALVLYAADRIEPGRPHIAHDYINTIADVSLQGLVIDLLQENIRYLNEMGYEISPLTENFLYSLMKNNG